MNHFVNVGREIIDRPVYRYLTMGRLLEYFRTKQYVLVKPSSWDDPFESYLVESCFDKDRTTLDRPLRNTIYGSCWTRKSVSDALWRIYSPDKLSVRIRSTPRLLGELVASCLSAMPESKWFIGRVDYLPQSEIVRSAKLFSKKIVQDHSELAAAQSLLFKRRSFAHEDEVRLLVFDRHNRAKNALLHLGLDPFEVIQSIMIDSRTSKDIAEMYTRHLKREIGFKGRISQSELYDPPMLVKA